MKQLFIAVLLAMTVITSFAQETEDRKALTSTGLVMHAGEIGRTYGGGLIGGGFVLDIGKRFVPQLQCGIGIMPSVNADVEYLNDYADDNVKDDRNNLLYEHKGAYFAMPVYAWVKYDFMKRNASPFVYCGMGSQVSNIKSASGGLYRSINAGCRIALHKIAISPFAGFYGEGKYEHYEGGGIAAGVFVEF